MLIRAIDLVPETLEKRKHDILSKNIIHYLKVNLSYDIGQSIRVLEALTYQVVALQGILNFHN